MEPETELDAGALIGDAGPDFNPAPAAAAPAAGVDVGAALEGSGKWHASRVGSILAAQGQAVHAVLAVDKSSTEWCYTRADLDAIAPPLARILNRYPATRVAAEGGDELAVALGFGGYFLRSYGERRLALALANQEPAEPAYVEATPPPAPEPIVQTADELEAQWPDVGDTPPIRTR